MSALVTAMADAEAKVARFVSLRASEAGINRLRKMMAKGYAVRTDTLVLDVKPGEDCVVCMQAQDQQVRMPCCNAHLCGTCMHNVTLRPAKFDTGRRMHIKTGQLHI